MKPIKTTRTALILLAYRGGTNARGFTGKYPLFTDYSFFREKYYITFVVY